MATKPGKKRIRRPGERGSRGRPEYAPTEKDRKLVLSMARVRIPEADIARCLGITNPTLRKYYRDELDNSWVVANAAVANKLYAGAMQGNAVKQIFYLKCRAGWKEPAQQHDAAQLPALPEWYQQALKQAALNAQPVSPGTDHSQPSVDSTGTLAPDIRDTPDQSVLESQKRWLTNPSSLPTTTPDVPE